MRLFLAVKNSINESYSFILVVDKMTLYYCYYGIQQSSDG